LQTLDHPNVRDITLLDKILASELATATIAAEVREPNNESPVRDTRKGFHQWTSRTVGVTQWRAPRFWHGLSPAQSPAILTWVSGISAERIAVLWTEPLGNRVKSWGVEHAANRIMSHFCRSVIFLTFQIGTS